MEDQNPQLRSKVFLVSSVRSGSTVLNLMLSQHPDICWIGECDYMHKPLVDVKENLTVEQFLERLKYDRIFNDRNFSINPEIQDIKQLCESFFNQKNTMQKKLIGGTLHHEFSKILQIYTDAKFITLTRDPRDVANSAVQIGFAGIPYFGVDHWIIAEKNLSALKALVPKERIHDIFFEKLIESPQLELTKLCSFMGMNYDEKMLGYSSNSTYSLPDKSRNFAWKKGKKSKELAFLEWKLKEAHLKYGYEKTESVKPHKLDLCILHLKEFFARKKFNLTQFGTLPYLAFLICKSLSFIPWFKYKAIAISHHVTRKHLK